MALETHGATRFFDGIGAVQDVTLVISPGDLAGLIGPNGAGKSTLVNLISGSLALTRGSVSINGADASKWSPERIARAGVVRTHQRCRIFPELTVEQNVRVAVLQRRGERGERRSLVRGRRKSLVESALARFGLGSVRDRSAGELPFGLQRRLELGRAVATDPRFLLLDEPFSGMEAEDIAEMSAIVRSLTEASIGVLLIEHHTEALFALCNRVTVMNSGRVIANGDAVSVQAMEVVRKAYLGERHSTARREVSAR